MNTYPKDWAEIAERIKTLAGWRCEHCGHEHAPGKGYTLTVHHLDGDKSNCGFGNLVALCQRCHLRIQAKYVPGQLWLCAVPGWVARRGLNEDGWRAAGAPILEEKHG